MNASVPRPSNGEKSYLDVRYAEENRPFTDYPGKLTHYLSERYLLGYRGGRLLDLGCGRGEFLHGFANEGFRVTGVDRSRPSRPRSAPTCSSSSSRRCG